MAFHRYRCFYSLSYFRVDESLIYKSLQVGESETPLWKNVSLFSMYLHYLETYLFFFLFLGGMLLDLNNWNKLLKLHWCKSYISKLLYSLVFEFMKPLWYNIKEQFHFALQDTFIRKNYECLGLSLLATATGVRFLRERLQRLSEVKGPPKSHIWLKPQITEESLMLYSLEQTWSLL